MTTTKLPMNVDERATLEIVETYVTLEQFTDSEYPKKQTSNFDRCHNLKKDLARWDKYDPAWYIVKANPELNYGLDFRIFASYKADGINFLVEVSLGGGSSLTNHGLRRVMFNDGKIYFSEEAYDKSQPNRKALRERSDIGWVFS